MLLFGVILWIVALFIFWIVFLRSWLHDQPWAWSQAFFSVIEPVERWLWNKSETILFARVKIFVGVLLTVLTQIGTIDLTPLLPFIPDEYEGLVKFAFNLLPLTLSLLGVIDEALRRDTTKPLAIVALPDIVPAALASAVADVEIANVVAVAAIKEEKLKQTVVLAESNVATASATVEVAKAAVNESVEKTEMAVIDAIKKTTE